MSILRTTTIVTTAGPSAPSQRQSDSGLLTDIFKAYYDARSNKRNTHSQVRFERNLSFNLNTLYEAVRDRTYRPARSMCFIIRDPVQREVFAASFRDRIIHHYLYNQLEPVFEPAFIYDSYSCRKGKGTLFGIERLEHHIRSSERSFPLTAGISAAEALLNRIPCPVLSAPESTFVQGFAEGFISALNES